MAVNDARRGGWRSAAKEVVHSCPSGNITPDVPSHIVRPNVFPTLMIVKETIVVNYYDPLDFGVTRVAPPSKRSASSATLQEKGKTCFFSSSSVRGMDVSLRTLCAEIVSTEVRSNLCNDVHVTQAPAMPLHMVWSELSIL